MIASHRSIYVALLVAGLALAGCSSGPPRPDDPVAASNQVRTSETDRRAADEARSAAAESDAELNRQLRATGAEELPDRHRAIMPLPVREVPGLGAPEGGRRP